MSKPDPTKPDETYGADLTGTLIAVYPVTDETVCQTSLTMKDAEYIKLEVDPTLLPKEGTPVKIIIEATGKIVRVEQREKGVSLLVDAGTMDLGDVTLGDSIACSGVCLTVVARDQNCFGVDVSRETLDCTAGLNGQNDLNLEKALRLSDRLGGHLVSGHVDGVGEVIKFEPIGESHELVIRAPRILAKYIARKGSICVDGVSLTTNAVTGAEFSINLIPHTVEVTTLKRLKPGSRVNLEVDLIARYVERMLAPSE